MVSTSIQAHRGASAYRPENTLEAFSLALEQGADSIELDVHLTKDGYVVVAHDERIDRVSNGVGFINDYTLAELKSFNFNRLLPEQPHCSIPMLSEVYSLIKETVTTVNVELKTSSFPYPNLPDKLVAIAREHSISDRVLYSSFNHYSLMDLKQINPNAKIGLLYDKGIVDPWVYAQYTSATAIHPNYAAIVAFPDTVKQCHDIGVMVNVWTVDDPRILKDMFNYGVDTIITNKPDLAISIRDGLM